MLSPTQRVCVLVSMPPHPECVDVDPSEICWVCGAACSLPRARAMPRADWQGASFTGQNRVKGWASAWVCEACVSIMSRFAPVPPRPAKDGLTDKGKPYEAPRWSNFSVLCDDRGHVVASKGEKPAILAWLRAPKHGPWFAAIADSGQKHTLPWAMWCGATGPGRVLFEEQVVPLPRTDAGWALVDAMCALLTAGATKDEIAAGEYRPETWQRCGADVETFERAHGTARSSAWWSLALWLSQRDEALVEARLAREAEERAAKAVAQKPARSKARTPKAAKAPQETPNGHAAREDVGDDGRGLDPRDAPGGARVGDERPEALAVDPGPDAGSGAQDREPVGVHRDDPPRALPPVPVRGQLRLF